MEHQLLGVSDVAKRIGCSDSHVRRLIQRGGLPALKVGHLVRVHPDELDRWLARQRFRAAS